MTKNHDINRKFLVVDTVSQTILEEIICTNEHASSMNSEFIERDSILAVMNLFTYTQYLKTGLYDD